MPQLISHLTQSMTIISICCNHDFTHVCLCGTQCLTNYHFNIVCCKWLWKKNIKQTEHLWEIWIENLYAKLTMHEKAKARVCKKKFQESNVSYNILRSSFLVIFDSFIHLFSLRRRKNWSVQSVRVSLHWRFRPGEHDSM